MALHGAIRARGGAARGWLGPAAPGGSDLPGSPAGTLGGSAARDLLELLLGAEPEAWLRRMPGREALLGRLVGAPCVIKRFRGSPLGERARELLHGRAPRTSGRREAESLAALAGAGLAVPAVLAWAEDGAGRSAVAMEHVTHDEDLAQRLARAPRRERGALLARLAELVARLHRAGFYHRDLYLTHVVVRRSDGELVLLDAGRTRRERRPRTRWFVKDLAALLFSRPDAVTDVEALRFLARYAGLSGLAGDRAALRHLARRVAAKRDRIAAHEPRHADPLTFSPGRARPRGAGGARGTGGPVADRGAGDAPGPAGKGERRSAPGPGEPGHVAGGGDSGGRGGSARAARSGNDPAEPTAPSAAGARHPPGSAAG